MKTTTRRYNRRRGGASPKSVKNVKSLHSPAMVEKEESLLRLVLDKSLRNAPIQKESSLHRSHSPSSLRRSLSSLSGRNDEFVVEDIDDLTSLRQCKKKYRLLKFGYDVYEKRNAELMHQIEKLKRK